MCPERPCWRRNGPPPDVPVEGGVEHWAQPGQRQEDGAGGDARLGRGPALPAGPPPPWGPTFGGAARPYPPGAGCASGGEDAAPLRPCRAAPLASCPVLPVQPAARGSRCLGLRLRVPPRAQSLQQLEQLLPEQGAGTTGGPDHSRFVEGWGACGEACRRSGSLGSWAPQSGRQGPRRPSGRSPARRDAPEKSGSRDGPSPAGPERMPSARPLLAFHPSPRAPGTLAQARGHLQNAANTGPSNGGCGAWPCPWRCCGPPARPPTRRELAGTALHRGPCGRARAADLQVMRTFPQEPWDEPAKSILSGLRQHPSQARRREVSWTLARPSGGHPHPLHLLH
ncbi:uncharacterized protein [Notamacropus eugenii]|uniref:uncharacterized protein n=1 Tax=Notamacropus eugenii TaxID=9315 RepID=UPI003B677EA4